MGESVRANNNINELVKRQRKRCEGKQTEGVDGVDFIEFVFSVFD